MAASLGPTGQQTGVDNLNSSARLATTLEAKLEVTQYASYNP